MPWFIVDDGFHSHKKAVRAGVGAVGLWVLAGSWSADQLTDGFVPDYIAARLDSSYEEHAAALVKAGLWTESQLDGDEGWQFHQWSERQQSREDVMAKREAARERMRRNRAKKKEGSEDVRANTSRSSEKVREPDTDTDTDTKEPNGSIKPRTKRGIRLPEPFPVDDDMKNWARENAPHVGTTDHDRFCDYWRAQPGQKGVKVDWVATWRNWMRKANDDATRQTPNNHTKPRRATTDERVDQVDAALAAFYAEMGTG